MSKFIFIDANSVGYAAVNGTKLMSGQQETTAIIGFLKSLRDVLFRFPGAKPVVLWDGHAQFRYDIFPGYKDRSGKSSSTDDIRARWREQREHVQEILPMLNVTQVVHQDFEADDLACQLGDAYAAKGAEIIFVTGDRDWLQLLTAPNLKWYEHRNKEIVTFDQFEEVSGFKNPSAFVEGKALMGDVSDTIPGVGAIGETTAKALMAEYGSVKAFRELVKSGKVSKVGKALMRLVDDEPFTYRGKEYPAPSESFTRNMKLMDLRRAPKIPSNEIVITKANGIHSEPFAEVCRELAFMSILKDLNNFLAPFNR